VATVETLGDLVPTQVVVALTLLGITPLLIRKVMQWRSRQAAPRL
jgi:hypothetical protein